MYENLNYGEFRQLPDEEKGNALRELEKTYKEDRKKIAEHLNIKGNVLGILYSKYVEGNKLGRQKIERSINQIERSINQEPKNEVINEPEIKEEDKPNVFKQILSQPENKPVEEVEPKFHIPVHSPIIEEDESGFSIKLDKQIAGEEVKERVAGIVNSLLDNKKYAITLVIQELT
jgi:hypothetical protein